MFTGIVQSQGVVRSFHNGRLSLETPWEKGGLRVGQSVSIDGCCLTVVSVDGPRVEFDVSPETIRRTTFSSRAVGDLVNLERGLVLGDPIDGHWVTGHIDCAGVIREINTLSDGSKEMRFEVPASYSHWLADKGSVAIDGVSLTTFDVRQNSFSVALIPHTLQVTTLGKRGVGDNVNVEFDLLAKYVERLWARGAQREVGAL